MIEVTQHIERLLQYHDCVIVPGLGGFIAQDCGAKYVEEECVFLPPYRSVSFNPCLTMNDGLFVHEVAQQHHLSYEDALTAVEHAVSEIHKKILTRGKIKISGIGTLQYVNAKSYEFTPLPYGIEAPDLYGLDSYYFAPVEAEEEIKEAPVVQEEKKETDSFTINIPMNFIRYAAVAAVSAVFFFVCIAPLNNAIHQDRSEAGMFQQLWSLIAPQAPAVQEKAAQPATSAPTAASSQSESTQKAENAAEIQKESVQDQNAETTPATAEATTSPNQAETSVQQTTTAATADPAGPYTISIAAAIPLSGAEAMVTTMKSNGLTEARVVKGQMIRVVYGSFATEAEAQAELTKIRNTDPVFAQSWVLKIQ